MLDLSFKLAIPPLTRIAFNCVPMFCWTFSKHRLNPAAWLHIIVDSRADFSHLRKFSWEIGRDMGGALAIPACLAILKYPLFRREDPVCHEVTTWSESFFGFGWHPYHLVCDLGGRTNWSLKRPPASEARVGYP